MIPVGFDTEFGFSRIRRAGGWDEPDVTTGVPVCAALAFPGGEVRVYRPDDRRLADELARPDRLFVTHGAHAERAYCRLVGVPMPGRHFDSLLAGVLLAHADAFRPYGGAYAQAGLATLAARFRVPFTGTGVKSALRQSIMHLRHEQEYGWAAVADYCSTDARACLALYPLLRSAVERRCGPDALTHLERLHQPHAALMAAAAARGIRFDRDGWDRLTDSGRGYRRRLFAMAAVHGYDHDGSGIGVVAFRHVLARHGLLADWPKTETGLPSTCERDLKDRRGWHPAVDAVYRLVRFDAVLGQRLGERVDADGRVRHGVLPLAQHTSRLSVIRPNLLSLPGELRPLLLPEPGCVWVHADFAQHEPGVAAAVSGDPHLLADFKAGDVYLNLGRRTGLITPDMSAAEVKAVRDRWLKRLLLSVLYGQTAGGLARSLSCSVAEATGRLHLFQTMYPRLVSWARTQAVLGLSRGWAESVIGFRAAFATSDPRAVGHVARSCQNFVIQSSAAACFQAMGVHLTDAGLDVRLGLHDGYLVNVPDDPAEIEHMKAAVRAAAEDAVAELFPRLPCKVDVEVLHRFAKSGCEDSLDKLIRTLETEDELCLTP